MKRLLFAFALTSACGSAANPAAPAAVVTETPVLAALPTPAPVSAAAIDPFTVSTYTWHPSQYRATVTIHNGADRELIYAFVVWETFYEFGHARFFTTQAQHSIVQITVPAGGTVTTAGEIPDGCGRTYQADVYAGVLVENVIAGRVNLHPAATPKIPEASFKFGKSRAACAVPSAPSLPVPPVPPSVPDVPVIPPVVPPIEPQGCVGPLGGECEKQR